MVGICKRHTTNIGDKDWNEPCEPILKKYQLPWFYFITNADKLVEELREEYIRESNQLWGND